MTSALRASLAKRTTGMPWVLADRATAARDRSPAWLNSAGDGTGLPRCWVRNVTTCPPTSSTRRSVAIHPDEALLVELRERQQTPHGRAQLRERTKAGHSLAHIGYWQGRRARYLGPRKNLFDLRRAAVVHNLHVIARQPPGGQQAA